MNINKRLEEIINDHRKELYGAKYELADNNTKFRLQQLILEMSNEAVDKAYKDASKVGFKDAFYRKDIGASALKYTKNAD